MSSLEIEQVSGCAAGAGEPLVVSVLRHAVRVRKTKRARWRELLLRRLCVGAAERSSGRNGHIYIPIFYTETHIARLIKDSSGRGKQGRTENWSEGACCCKWKNKIKNKNQKKKQKKHHSLLMVGEMNVLDSVTEQRSSNEHMITHTSSV